MTQQTEPPLTQVRNFRDVGGLPTVDGLRVRPGQLYRSGHLAHASVSDITFLGSLGLNTVFDFRDAADIELEGPDVDLPGVRNVNIPLSDPAQGAEFWGLVRDGDLPRLRSILGDGQAADNMAESYRHRILDRTAEHSRVVHDLAADSMPALLHCAAGKDRAGVTVAVTLLAAGVEPDAIEADYLESNAPHRRYKVRRNDSSAARMPEEIRELLSPLFEARSSYLQAAFDTITATWGSTERYLADGLRLAPETRERLRERLLTV